MTRQRLVRSIIIAAICLSAGIAYRVTSHSETSLSSEKVSSQTVANVNGEEPSPNSVVANAAHDASGAGSGGLSARAGSTLKVFKISSEQRQTLMDYRKISHKVFLTNADKKMKARLLADRSFLLSLASIVTASTAGNADGGEAQNDALDLLYDAVGGEGKAAAITVLGQVVRDTQIENRDLTLKDRENLAGVKAEVLYEWTARDPSAAATVVAMLPGSVSHQLWQNVQARQDRNLASSAVESDK